MNVLFPAEAGGFSFLQSIRTGCGAHQVSCAISTKDEAAGLLPRLRKHTAVCPLPIPPVHGA